MDAKEAYIKENLKKYQDEYSENKKLLVVVGSWNVGEKIPSEKESFYEFFHLDQEPDIIAYGMQEIDMSANAMVTIKTEASDDWAKYLDNQFEISAKGKYVRVFIQQLVGLCLVIYVKKVHSTKLTHEKGDSVGVGALGKMGNKGGVGFRFKLYQSSFCFITSHLYPHMKGVEKRNQNFHEIMKRLTFGEGKSRQIDQHDFIYFFGDLNYRVGILDQDEVKAKIKEKDYEYLLQYDQLTIEKLGCRVLFEWEEAQIRFDPTYKYDKGTNVYDTSEKKRTPGWTDRIFWKGKLKHKISPKFYGKHDLMMSDHRPVSLVTEVEVKCIVEYKLREFRDQLSQEFDHLKGKISEKRDENAQINLSSKEFDFGDIRYGVNYVKQLILTNPCSFTVEYQFIPKDEDKFCASWLTISSKNGIIINGGTQEIKLTIHIDKQNALKLNNEKTSELTEKLLLHLTNGASYEILIQGNFLKTSFGNSIEELVCWYEPVRTKLPKKLGLVKMGEIKKLKVPKELFYLCDYISKYGMRDAGLFQESGNISEVNIIRDKIDSGESLEDFTGSIHSVCETLINFLDSLLEPVIPTYCFPQVLESYSNPQSSIDVIRKLNSDSHNNTFHYITSFFRELLENKDANNLNIDIISSGFSRVLMRSPQGRSLNQLKEDEKASIEFLKHFLKEKSLWTTDTFCE